MYIPKRSSTDMGCRLYAKQRVQRFSPVPVVRMEMPKLTVPSRNWQISQNNCGLAKEGEGSAACREMLILEVLKWDRSK